VTNQGKLHREHLKRVHSPVQCERCHEIFPGTDRALCLSQLAEHRKMDVACELGDPSRKEGIDEAQWAALDKQNRKKSQEAHRVEKWFEIWDVLFPGRPRPKSPCKLHRTSKVDGKIAHTNIADQKGHDIASPGLPTSSSPSRDAESFANLFLNIMDHKVAQGDIDLADPDNIRHGVKSVAQLTFKTYISLHGRLSPETSSGDSRNRPSLAGASSTHLSDPVTMASHQLSATTAGTSIVSGHGSQAGRPQGSYAMGSPYGMRIPRAMANPPRPFMAAPPMPQVPAGPDMTSSIQQPPLQASGMPTFGGMSAADPGGAYYYPYMFSPPQGSWAPSNPVAFPQGHMTGMGQDYGLGGAGFFAEAQNFGPAPTEGG